MQKFSEQKQKQLSKADKSNIGKWDLKIRDLCNKINKNKDYCTTSSCSGRIVLLKASDEKQPDAFLFRTHNKISFKELKKILEKIKESYNEIVEFQQTSCILHVACSSIEKAQDIVNKAKQAGWKRSGIMGGKRNMVELHSTENMSFPIINNNRLLVNDDFLKLVINIANQKLERVWKKVEKLENFI